MPIHYGHERPSAPLGRASHGHSLGWTVLIAFLAAAIVTFLLTACQVTVHDEGTPYGKFANMCENHGLEPTVTSHHGHQIMAVCKTKAGHVYGHYSGKDN